MAIALIGLCMTSAAPGQQADVLSNADIVTLTEAGLAPSAIVAVIEASGADFDISVTESAALTPIGGGFGGDRGDGADRGRFGARGGERLGWTLITGGAAGQCALTARPAAGSILYRRIEFGRPGP